MGPLSLFSLSSVLSSAFFDFSSTFVFLLTIARLRLGSDERGQLLLEAIELLAALPQPPLALHLRRVRGLDELLERARDGARALRRLLQHEGRGIRTYEEGQKHLKGGRREAPAPRSRAASSARDRGSG